MISAIRIVTDYTIIILLTLFGFLALAAILLVPVYRFLRREEDVSRRWTQDEIARRGSKTSVNGGAQSKRPRSGDTAVDDEP